MYNNSVNFRNSNINFKANQKVMKKATKLGIGVLKDVPSYMNSETSQAFRNVLLGGLGVTAINVSSTSKENKISNITNDTAKTKISSKQIENVFDDLEIKWEKNPETNLYKIDNFEMGLANKDRWKILELSLKINNIDSANMLLENVEEIKNHANFYYSGITSLGNIKSIGGDVTFFKSQVKNLGKLTQISGSACFGCTQIESFGKLAKIGGDVRFDNVQINDLGKLTQIGGDAYFIDSEINDLKNLKKIGGNACFKNSNITNLGKLKLIEGNLSSDDFKLLQKTIGQVKVKGHLQSIQRHN